MKVPCIAVFPYCTAVLPLIQESWSHSSSPVSRSIFFLKSAISPPSLFLLSWSRLSSSHLNFCSSCELGPPVPSSALLAQCCSDTVSYLKVVTGSLLAQHGGFLLSKMCGWGLFNKIIYFWIVEIQ